MRNVTPISNSNQIQSEGNADRNQDLGNFTCNICGRPHGTMANLLAHRDVHSNVPTVIPTSLSDDFASIHIGECALQRHFCIYDLTPNQPCSDVLQFFQMSAELVKKLIVSLSTTHVLQARMILRARFFRVDGEGRQLDEVYLYFPSLPLSLVAGDEEHWYTSHYARIFELMDTFARNSSNLEFDSVERVQIKMTLRDNVDGQGIFPLPPKLAKKRAAIINVDAVSACFKYALLSILHYNDVANDKRKDPNSYEQLDGDISFEDLDVNNISINDIPKIEKLNNLKINIHVWENGKLTIRYNNRQVVAPKTINLLLVSHQGLRHYCGIISLKRLYYDGDSLRKHRPLLFCERCCREFSCWRHNAQQKEESLEQHYKYCREGRFQLEAVPKEKQFSYTSYFAEESPFAVCYSDIESYMEPQTKNIVLL